MNCIADLHVLWWSRQGIIPTWATEKAQKILRRAENRLEPVH